MSALTVFLVILILLLVILALCEFLIHFALDRQAPWTLEKALYPPKRLAAEQQDPDVCWFLENSSSVERDSPDGLRLSARLLPGERPHQYVIACHGYCNSPSGTAVYTRHFHAEGFTVLCPSARAHAQSGGRWIGMGWPDRLDLVDWAVWLQERDPEAKICLFGMSMGAATVLMAAGEPLPHAVCCGVSDSAFTSVREEYESQLRRWIPLPAGPILWLIDRMAAPRTGWHLQEASAVAQLKKAEIPLLFVHGEEDRFVPFSMLEQVYAACASPVKQKLSIPGAGHCRSVHVDPERYWAVVDEFMQQAVSGECLTG